ncbi:type VI secretion system tube protein TssD [Capnocytophaga gingivalis]|uniref:Type VI secretion system tube protein TssD n=1 Tax=Capnocytophaga gingivalis TaxID=1017 RepID=A0ABU5YBW5_9FLAO|nr:type VI secretion system tube protein TssD [Capnocytophaga gingivalis]MEB3041447.1 type VI secretion system tube protein TssD [Capnocytophaga gingivalis]
MIGILNIAGHQRKLLSLTTSYSKTVSKKGYPNSLPIAHFFKVSFLTEEGDDFFADWMYGKNNHYQWQKGQWYNGTITFYDDTSYGQEFLHYELTTALATSFRVDYDQEKGMITTLEIFARERVYDHKFIINSEYYAIMFDYVEVKDKIQQLLNTDPDLFELYYTDESGKRIENNDFKVDSFIYVNVRGENLIGKIGNLNLTDKNVDFEYEGNRLENDTLQDYTFKSNNEIIKLKVIEPKKDN